jgi:hypothetical protein
MATWRVSSSQRVGQGKVACMFRYKVSNVGITQTMIAVITVVASANTTAG